MSVVIEADNMTDIFHSALMELDKHGQHRTQSEPLELMNFQFKLTNLDNNIVCTKGIDFGYLCAEELWYAVGSEQLSFINSFTTPGFRRTSEDKLYSNSAYGHIIHFRHGFDQLEQVIDILSKKPNSRRAVINLNTPNPHRGTCLDEICTFNLTFYIIDGKLNCTCNMRSNDVIGCMPYDVAYFTNLQKYIARRLDIPTGYYYHFAVSAHHYYDDINNRYLLSKYKVPVTKKSFDFEKLIEKKDSLWDVMTKTLEENPDDVNGNTEKLLNLFYNLQIIKEEK